MKLNIAGLFLSCAAFAVAQDSTIVELALATEELSTLVSVVQAAGLAETLADPSAIYTVFAPTNDALTDFDVKYLTEPWMAHLQNIVLYHVLDTEVLSTAITDGMVITALSGDNFTATLSGTDVFLGNEIFSSQVTSADIDAVNGVIHLVNALFMPSWMNLTLADIALNVEGFDSVATFIKQAGLEDEIAAENRTIFAPSADAFAAISPDLTAKIVNDESLVGVILKHHIVEGVWSKASLTDGLELTTLDGNTLVVSVSGDSYMVGGSEIVESDFLAKNGVSFVISTILLPPSLANETEVGSTAPGAPPVDPPVAGPPTPGTTPVTQPISSALVLGSAFSLFAAGVVALF